MGRRDDAFWAEYLDIEQSDWDAPGVSYRPHAGLDGFRGFWCFRRKERVVISAPPRWLDRIEVLLSGWSRERLMDPTALGAAFGPDFELAVGPAFQGAIRGDQFTPRLASHVREVVSADGDALARFQSECGDSDWATSGLAHAKSWRHAYFEADKIIAMAIERGVKKSAIHAF